MAKTSAGGTETVRVRRTTTERDDDHLRLTLPDVVKFLQDVLGTRLTAHIAGVADPKMVGRWIEGTKPAQAREKKLRDTLQIFKVVMNAEDEFVARSWFIGMNPNLDDEAPADAIREGNAKDALAAARVYANGH